jgi:hypothetical protein
MLRLLLSVFLIVMALLCSLRISIGAAPPSSFSIDSSMNIEIVYCIVEIVHACKRRRQIKETMRCGALKRADKFDNDNFIQC